MVLRVTAQAAAGAFHFKWRPKSGNMSWEDRSLCCKRLMHGSFVDRLVKTVAGITVCCSCNQSNSGAMQDLFWGGRKHEGCLTSLQPQGSNSKPLVSGQIQASTMSR